MKKILFIAVFTLMLANINAQVFNTSSTLKKGHFSAGFEPGVYVGGNTDFTLFLHGGVGITSNMDLGIKLGVLDGSVYFGGDLEFAIAKIFSLSFGAHAHNNFALDGTALFTFPLKNGIGLYTGLDMDIWFIDTYDGTDVVFPLWLPLGVRVKLRSYMDFLFETEISVTNPGEHFIGGGLNFYF